MSSNPVSLRKVHLFNHLSDEKLGEIEAVLESRELKAGEKLFDMGDPGNELFIVADGEIEIYAPDPDSPGEEQPIRIFKQEEVLGDMALIDHKPRSLSARARNASRVLALGETHFRRFVQGDTELAFAIMNGLSDRIRYTTEFLNEVRFWVERVSEGDYNDPDFLKHVGDWARAGGGDETEQATGAYQDEAISALASDFALMAAQVQQREEELRQSLVRLTIEIDEAKAEQDFARITETDFFQSLKARAEEMRAQ